MARNVNARPTRTIVGKSLLGIILSKVNNITRGINDITRSASNLNRAVRNAGRVRDQIRDRKTGRSRINSNQKPLNLTPVAKAPNDGRNVNVRPTRRRKGEGSNII